MEHDSFDDPIFGEFGGGPLNPLGAKPLMPTTTAMHPVMLGSVHELCSQQQQQQQQQRLPDCNTILPNGGGGGAGSGGAGGSPNYVTKLDFVNKMGCYSPSQKYEYISAPQKLVEQQQQQHHHHSSNSSSSNSWWASWTIIRLMASWTTPRRPKISTSRSSCIICTAAVRIIWSLINGSEIENI